MRTKRVLGAPSSWWIRLDKLPKQGKEKYKHNLHPNICQRCGHSIQFIHAHRRKKGCNLLFFPFFIVISPIILSNSHYPSCFPGEQRDTANPLFAAPLWMMNYAKDFFLADIFMRQNEKWYNTAPISIVFQSQGILLELQKESLLVISNLISC